MERTGTGGQALTMVTRTLDYVERVWTGEGRVGGEVGREPVVEEGQHREPRVLYGEDRDRGTGCGGEGDEDGGVYMERSGRGKTNWRGTCCMKRARAGGPPAVRTED